MNVILMQLLMLLLILSFTYTFIDKLMCANLEACILDVIKIRKSYPKLIPKSISHQDAAKLLGN